MLSFCDDFIMFAFCTLGYNFYVLDNVGYISICNIAVVATFDWQL